MSIDPNLLIAAKLIHDECVKNSSCTNCQLRDICVWESAPNDWEIPDPPPEPTERQRIEWARMLPDKELIKVAFGNKGLSCSYCEGDSDEYCGLPCHERLLPWWHKEVALEKFRKDVGLSNDTDS